MRFERKERHDLKHGICEKELAIKNIILLHDTQCGKKILQKLAFKWLGPYQISNAIKDKGTYMLEEFDRLQLANISADNRLKKFHPWQQLYLDHTPNFDYEE